MRHRLRRGMVAMLESEVLNQKFKCKEIDKNRHNTTSWELDLRDSDVAEYDASCVAISMLRMQTLQRSYIHVFQQERQPSDYSLQNP